METQTDLQPGVLAFCCNVCGAANVVELGALRRETTSCACGSTPRWRAIVHLVSTGLFGESLLLDDFPLRKDIRGLGLSDCVEYADKLAERLDYVNTFFDEEPQLDITAVDPALFGSYDFIIASDVFEHVLPPVERAFENAMRLLRPGGFLVITVPYGDQGSTTEHFPDLNDFQVFASEGTWLLRNTTRDGSVQQFDHLTFHGGPGFTLEMREFSKPDLERSLIETGFASVEFFDEPYFPFGVYWPGRWSFPIVARRAAAESPSA
jgi:SAM-dependent methyltransferase